MGVTGKSPGLGAIGESTDSGWTGNSADSDSTSASEGGSVDTGSGTLVKLLKGTMIFRNM